MRIAHLLQIVALICLLPAVAAARGERDRVMVGEDIFVAEDEDLHDVVCIGCSIRVEGRVAGGAVVIGGSLVIDGEVGEAVAIGGSIDVAGRVDRGVVAVAGSIAIEGVVGGDVVAAVGSVELDPDAEVGGDITAVLGSVKGFEEARVGGTVHSQTDVAPFAKFGLILVLILFLVFGLVFQPLLVLVSFFILGERRIETLSDTTRQRPGMSFLIGLGVIFAWMILSTIGAIIPFWIPGIGFPLSIGIFVLLVVGYTGISYWVGRSLLSDSGPLAAALLGAVLVTILQLIPIIGWMALCVFALLALGSALLSGFGSSVDWLLKRSEIEPMARPVVR